IVAAAQDVTAPGQRNMQPRIPIPAAGLEHDHADVAILAQPVGQGTTGGARADDHVITGLMVGGHGFRISIRLGTIKAALVREDRAGDGADQGCATASGSGLLALARRPTAWSAYSIRLFVRPSRSCYFLCHIDFILSPTLAWRGRDRESLSAWSSGGRTLHELCARLRVRFLRQLRECGQRSRAVCRPRLGLHATPYPD